MSSRKFPRLRHPAIAALVTVLLLGCTSPTAPEALAVHLEPVRLETEEQFLSWPAEPVFTGGEVLVIRGTGLAGCGTLVAEASLKGRTVDVRISTVGDQSPCILSRWAWEPFVATIGALPPGDYTVRVRVVGYDTRVRGDVTIE